MRAGFTIIEAVLIILVVSIGLFGVMYLYSNISYKTFDTDMSVIATDLARDKIERMLALKAVNGYAGISSSGAPETKCENKDCFTRVTTVSLVDPASGFQVSAVDKGYKKIEIVVGWGENRKVSLATIVSDQVPPE